MQVAIGLYDGFTALDFVGPYQVLSQPRPAPRWCCAPPRPAPSPTTTAC